MIENIRKYTGLMIVVFVILFISFFFLDTGSVRNMGGGEAVLKIAGRTYNDKEFRTLGTASHDLAMSLAQTGDFGIYQFVMALTTGGTGAQDAEKFFINRMILRQAKDRFGVHPGDEEINDYIRSMREVGFTSLSEDQLVKMRIHKVDALFIRHAREDGFSIQTPGDAVDLAIHGPWRKRRG